MGPRAIPGTSGSTLRGPRTAGAGSPQTFFEAELLLMKEEDAEAETGVMGLDATLRVVASEEELARGVPLPLPLPPRDKHRLPGVLMALTLPGVLLSSFLSGLAAGKLPAKLSRGRPSGRVAENVDEAAVDKVPLAEWSRLVGARRMGPTGGGRVPAWLRGVK